MAKVTMVLCDVKPCTGQADREFEVNGQTFYVCGEQCYARFWSREYGNWKVSRYRMQITLLHFTQAQEYETEERFDKKNSTWMFNSDLQIVKTRQG